MQRAALFFAILAIACSGSETRTPTGVPSDTTGGGVQRATLALSIQADPRDSALARQLGWTTGLPGASVTVQRLGGGAAVSAISDLQGTANVSALLPGTYVVSALRMLQPGERALLDSSDSDVDAFGGGMTITVGVPRTNGTLALAAGRRGSLVISEVWKGFPSNRTAITTSSDTTSSCTTMATSRSRCPAR